MDTPTLTEQHDTGVGTDTGRVRVAVAGATGFAGQELLRWLAAHPRVTVTSAMSSSPEGPARSLPALARIWNGVVEPFSAEKLGALADAVFLALPEEAAAAIAPKLVEQGVRVIDLSGAFRLRDEAARAAWYPETHRMPAGVAYGLTERERGSVARAQLVANPGCYPTATLLALSPLVEAGLLLPNTDVIVDAKSGVSGAAKRPPSARISPRSTAAWRPTACSIIVMAPKSNRVPAAR